MLNKIREFGRNAVLMFFVLITNPIGAICIGILVFNGAIQVSQNVGRAYDSARLNLCIGNYIEEGRYEGVYYGNHPISFEIKKGDKSRAFYGYPVEVLFEDSSWGETKTYKLNYRCGALHITEKLDYGIFPSAYDTVVKNKDGSFSLQERRLYYNFGMGGVQELIRDRTVMTFHLVEKA